MTTHDDGLSARRNSAASRPNAASGRDWQPLADHLDRSFPHALLHNARGAVRLPHPGRPVRLLQAIFAVAPEVAAGLRAKLEAIRDDVENDGGWKTLEELDRVALLSFQKLGMPAGAESVELLLFGDTAFLCCFGDLEEFVPVEGEGGLVVAALTPGDRPRPLEGGLQALVLGTGDLLGFGCGILGASGLLPDRTLNLRPDLLARAAVEGILETWWQRHTGYVDWEDACTELRRAGYTGIPSVDDPEAVFRSYFEQTYRETAVVRDPTQGDLFELRS